jgi:hypothetical protein
MAPIGRSLILIGVVFIVLGLVLGYSDLLSFLRLGRLPGDIVIRKENFRFYFPITTCILISLVITLVAYLFRK